jgi:multiple sugar transport system ATP-binding protein
MATIELSAIRKSFDGTEILKGVDLRIEDGEFISLVGPSGCGKSTLLRVIAGLEPQSAGEVRIDGVAADGIRPSARNLAMVFQSYALYPHMSVRGNIGFGLKMAGLPKDEINRKVEAAAAALDLTPYLDRKPRELSGGQRQRVAIGRAIVREPKAFLFDEPLSNLDAALRVQMRIEVTRLQKQLGTTAIYVTHDQIEAMTMADKIVVMQDGIVEQMGSPLELYDHPDNKFVAGFIGSPAMNFLEGKLVGSNTPHVETANGSKLPLAASRTGLDGKPVIYGIRPEHLEFADDGIEADVIVVEPTGSETQIVARIGQQDLIAVIRDRRPVKPGDKIRLRPNPAAAHVFDKETGKRLIN